MLHNLWQFPNVPGNLSILEVRQYLKDKNISYLNIQKGIDYTHVFTHKKWKMNCYVIEIPEKINFEDLIWVTSEELEKSFAIPSAFQPFKIHLQ